MSALQLLTSVTPLEELLYMLIYLANLEHSDIPPYCLYNERFSSLFSEDTESESRKHIKSTITLHILGPLAIQALPRPRDF